MELAYLPVTELSALVGSRRISPVEIVQSLLARIGDYDGELHTYITVCGGAALAAARTAEAEITAGRRRGPLHGIPVCHKDNIWTQGVRTTAHSLALQDFVPETDATAVARLARAGMVMLGKANTAEFATGGMMNHFGWCQNPWDHGVYCGVSSSGSAAAVAAGLAVAATGSDTGGSIRMPASFCGIVGLKPTYGRVSRHGLIPLSFSMDNIGPMTRTVADAALLLGAMAGHDPLDPHSAVVPVPDFTAGLGRDAAGLVLGVPRQHFFDLLEPVVAEAVAAALGQFESLGARLEAVDLPLASELAEASRTIVAVESYAAHRVSLGVRGHLYSERPRRSIEHGAACTPEQYAAAQVLRARWTEQVHGVLARVDALVTPTMATAPYPVAVWLNNDTERMGPGMTYHFNLARLPALTLPCGFTPAGHPLGLQLVGRAFDEATLLRIAHAYEQSAGWYRRRPPRYA